MLRVGHHSGVCFGAEKQSRKRVLRVLHHSGIWFGAGMQSRHRVLRVEHQSGVWHDVLLGLGSAIVSRDGAVVGSISNTDARELLRVGAFSIAGVTAIDFINAVRRHVYSDERHPVIAVRVGARRFAC